MPVNHNLGISCFRFYFLSEENSTKKGGKNTFYRPGLQSLVGRKTNANAELFQPDCSYIFVHPPKGESVTECSAVGRRRAQRPHSIRSSPVLRNRRGRRAREEKCHHRTSYIMQWTGVGGAGGCVAGTIAGNLVRNRFALSPDISRHVTGLRCKCDERARVPVARATQFIFTYYNNIARIT